MLDVIGAGFGRTGTLSLKLALERLGFSPCHHMRELIDKPEQVALWARVARAEAADWDEVYRGYRATVDWPGACYWRELTGHFPQAKVVLTVRDPQRWYESAKNSIYRGTTTPTQDPTVAAVTDVARRLVWDGEFGGRFADVDRALEVFAEHNDAVRREIPADRLLEFEVREGWRPLCGFLGVPVPDEPFPNVNDRNTWTRDMRLRSAEQHDDLTANASDPRP